MHEVKVSLLGGFELNYHGSARENALDRRSRSLFAYLCLNATRPRRRDELIEVFWPAADSNRGERCLATALWRLRKGFAAIGLRGHRSPIKSTGGAVRINPTIPIVLDVKDVADRINGSTATAPDAAPVTTACDVASALDTLDEKGELMCGVDDPWIEDERNRLCRLRLTGFGWMMRYAAARGDDDGALEAGWRVLNADPFCEVTQTLVLRLLIRAGRRHDAINHYRWCRTILADELGLAPSAEAQALIRAVTDRRFA